MDNIGSLPDQAPGKHWWQDHQAAGGWFGTGWSSGFRLACPLWSFGDVHACGLRHVGDGMLPCQERLQRFDEELGECVLWNLGLVEHWLGSGLWRTEWQWLHWNRRFLWLWLLHKGQGQRSDHTRGMHLWWLPVDHVELVLSMGLLHGRCHHCERGSGWARQEPHLCRIRVLDDKLHLSYGCGINLGWRLACLPLRRGVHGLCRIRPDLHRAFAMQVVFVT